MTTSPIFDRNVTAEQMMAALDQFGYAIVRELADQATMDRLNGDFDPYLDRVQLGRTDFAGHKTKRINNLIAKSRACQELAAHPLVMAACDRVLLPHCARYHLNVTAVIELQPGERAQVLHRDGGIYPVLLPSIPLSLATIWACTDFTAENGGTSVVPGSQRWPHDREPQPSEIMPAVMPRGSLLIYASNLFHGSGENRSNGVRRGMTLQYSLGWLRQEENQYLSLPVEIARSLPEPIQRLVGYDLGGPYLGFVEAGHPQALLGAAAGDMARTMPELDRAAARLRPLRIEEA